MEMLRNKMKELNLKCLLIPSNDFNLSEYVNDYFKARSYYSGFTGSAGDLVITLDNAYLFTDGRYYIQAKRELKDGIKLVKMEDELKLDALLNQFSEVAVDLRTIPASMLKKHNFIDFKYALEYFKRDEISYSDHIILDTSITGESYLDKVNKIRKYLKDNNSNNLVLTMLDEIAYVLNIRGYDIKYCMLNYAYLIITLDDCIFFSDKKLDLNITQYNYNDFYDYLKKLNGTTIIDSSTINALAYKNINDKLDKKSYVNYIKSIKNESEIKNIKMALLKDSSLMIRFINYVKNNYKNKTENEIKNYLDNLRLSNPNILDLSFETICAYNESAAMLHYNGMDNLKLDDGLLLVDSGAQYKFGTTDITRTILLGKINDEFKKYYTYTLKSLIALSNVTFKKDTLGGELDFLARSKIFDLFIDYRCGTGHGVGFISNVHEGPNSFRYHNQTKITEGMITTIEPGIYIENKVGIRLENMVLPYKVIENEFGSFMKFETLTYIPFEIEAIDKSLLSLDEINWLNDYHNEVYNKLKDEFKDDINILKMYTKKI